MTLINFFINDIRQGDLDENIRDSRPFIIAKFKNTITGISSIISNLICFIIIKIYILNL